MEIFKIENIPVGEVYYIPEFVTENEENQLLQNVYNVPLSKWTHLAKRRLQNWGGVPHPNGMIEQPLPRWLELCIAKLESYNIFDGKKPNHVLINEYKPNEGIMPHLDGPLYYPAIATLTLGSHTILDFHEGNCREHAVFSLYLEPRSLLIQKGDIYHTLLHGIQERTEDKVDTALVNVDESHPQYNQTISRGTRVSLTIRHVPKIAKLKIWLGK